jgi:hypothetical protein
VKRTIFLAWIVALVLAMWPVAPPAAAPRCYPVSRFVVLPGGLVRDTLTKLVWQQQSSTTTMKWAAAQTYCPSVGTGFRLPTVRELESLVDLAVPAPGPTIDGTAFPDTPGKAFWTSSPYLGSSGYTWYVDFSAGSSDVQVVDALYGVRCVQ